MAPVIGYETLYKILNMEDVDKILNMEDVDVEKYDRLFYLYYCKFTTDVNAHEVAQQLLIRDVGLLK